MPGKGEEWRGMAKPLQVHPGQEQMDREGNSGRRLPGLPETATLLPSPSLDQACPCSSALPTYGEEECSPISTLPRLRCRFPLWPGAVEACLLHQLRRRAAGFLRSDKMAALFTKVGKTCVVAGEICHKVQALQQQVEGR